MASTALIYHPKITHFNAFVATTVGRDKLLRTIQYFSRFLAWYLYRTNHPQSSISIFSNLKTNFALVRKCMRLGKFVEHLRAAAVASDSKALALSDPVLRFCAVGRQLGYAGYLAADMATYPDASGVWKSSGAKRLQREAYRFWAMGLAFSVVSGVYSLWKLRVEGQRKVVVQGTETEKAVEGKKVARDAKQARIQLISDLCDLTVPASALAWVDLDDGIVGLAGTVSSLIGLQAQWQKTAPTA